MRPRFNRSGAAHQEAGFIAELAQAIEAAGGRLLHGPKGSGSQPDLVFKWHGAKFIVELKASKVNRMPYLEGLLSSALLESRRAAGERSGRPLPVLGLDRLSDRTLSSLMQYMDRVAADADWGILDRHGRRHFKGTKFDALNDPGRVRPRAERGSRSSFDLFTDLGQWMSKVLLARRLPLQMLAAPRERIRNARHLGEVSQVSAPTAARWVQHMRRDGFIEESDNGLRIVRRRAFFDQWRHALARPRREISARFLLPSGTPSDHASFIVARYAFERLAQFDPDDSPAYQGELRWKHGPRVCLGMFEAANAHGLARVSGAPVHLYMEELSEESLKPFELTRVKGNERHDITVSQPRFPQSTFRGAVLAERAAGKVPVVDVLQSWLELTDHPARGRESAEEIGRLIERWILKDDEHAAG